MSPEKSTINIAELRGLLSLVTDATVNTTDLVEAMHKRIVHPPFLPSTPIQHLITGISGLVYNNVRCTTQLIGKGVDKTLDQFNPLRDLGLSFEKKETALAILNGVIGDHLSKNKNPLAISMQLRYQGKVLPLDAKSIHNAYSSINGKILLMVHGSCMADSGWSQKDHHHGEMLANEHNYTPLYLNYNSGLHISTNGQQFNHLLEELIEAWPVPVEEIVLLTHSMGGLVSRSAFHYGKKEKSTWIKYLRKMVFLGSPHHGAPLEKIGNYVDRLFDAIPYVKPFSRLGKIRSAGVTDLRFGNLLEEDWKGLDRFKKQKGSAFVPLPKKVNCYAVAACIGKESEAWKHNTLGDGMVLLSSALGQHKHSKRSLKFEEGNTYIAYETNHLGLLSSEEVYGQLKRWLAK